MEPFKTYLTLHHSGEFFIENCNAVKFEFYVVPKKNNVIRYISEKLEIQTAFSKVDLIIKN
jgi:hypothetical protein